MKKRWSCLTLALLLCLGSVHAAGKELFPTVNAYPGYADVKTTAWYYDNIKLCNEIGLMNGTDKGFQPEKTLTVAECAAVAARIRVALTGETIPGVTPLPGETLPWYQQYLGYMSSADATLTPMLAHPEEPCSRLQYLLLLNAALPSEQQLLNAINSITSLPDTDDDTVLMFYNAGILTGVDEQGSFEGDKTLTRAECAAMVSRIARPELRKSFVPKEKPDNVPPAAQPSQGEIAIDDSTTVMTVNGAPIPVETLKYWIGAMTYQANYSLYMSQGTFLDLSDPDAVQSLLSHAQDQAAVELFLQSKADQLGCTIDNLPAALLPTVPVDALERYVRENGLLCAKHILVDDIETANAVLDGMKATPTLDQFNALLSVFGTDPGMSSNPQGYLFGEGEMVEEFEAATKALPIGSYTREPVQSQFGYHIIWRLDPTTHPDLIEEYRVYSLEEQIRTWLQGAELLVNEQVQNQIDIGECYNSYVDSMQR